MRLTPEDSERAVLSYLTEEPQSILDILEWSGLRDGTVRNALARLVAAGVVQREWCGNARFGKYVYWQWPEAVQQQQEQQAA